MIVSIDIAINTVFHKYLKRIKLQWVYGIDHVILKIKTLDNL